MSFQKFLTVRPEFLTVRPASQTPGGINFIKPFERLVHS